MQQSSSSQSTSSTRNGRKKAGTQQNPSPISDLSEVMFVNLSSISKHLECSICSFFFFQPYRFRCGHTFCRECVNNLKKCQNANSQLKCPQCRVPVDLRYTSEDLIAKNMIEEQLVFCKNKQLCCNWKGQLRRLDDHLLVCNFKQSDKENRRFLADILDKDIRTRALSSDSNSSTAGVATGAAAGAINNAHSSLMSFCLPQIDEKLHENLNKNVGDSLLIRLLNRDKEIGTQIVRQMSSKDGMDSRGTSKPTLKKSFSMIELPSNSGFDEGDTNGDESEYRQAIRQTEELPSTNANNLHFRKLEGEQLKLKQSNTSDTDNGSAEDCDEVDELISLFSEGNNSKFSSKQSQNSSNKLNPKPRKATTSKPQQERIINPQKEKTGSEHQRAGRKRIHVDPLPNPGLQFLPQLKPFSDSNSN